MRVCVCVCVMLNFSLRTMKLDDKAAVVIAEVLERNQIEEITYVRHTFPFKKGSLSFKGVYRNEQCHRVFSFNL